jgi:hypothetical protein
LMNWLRWLVIGSFDLERSDLLYLLQNRS